MEQNTDYQILNSMGNLSSWAPSLARRRWNQGPGQLTTASSKSDNLGKQLQSNE